MLRFDDVTKTEALKRLLFELSENHDSTSLSKIKAELNKIFTGYSAFCKSVKYTFNDKLFFGIKVYPAMDGKDVKKMLCYPGDIGEINNDYCIEFDSKLLDPMMDLDPDELFILTIYSIYYGAVDIDTLKEIRYEIERYYAGCDCTACYDSDEIKDGQFYLLSYGIKDAMSKYGNPFIKSDADVVASDALVADNGYTGNMISALRKVVTNINFLQQDNDQRFITLSWALRVADQYEDFEAPACKTLFKAAELTGSELEKNEILYVVGKMRTVQKESVIMESPFSKWKHNSMKGIQSDVYELQLQLRTAEDPDDLMMILRSTNSKIAIIRDYLDNESHITDGERKELEDTLEVLYGIRQAAANDKKVRSKYSGYIQVVYPTT